jgi:hypothetical protein
MDSDYHREVNTKKRAMLKKKIASEPEPERYFAPSFHKNLCESCAGGRYVVGGVHSGGKFSLGQLASDAGRISKKIVRVGVPAMVGIGTTLEAGPAAGLAAAKASSELTNLITGGKSSGGKSSGGKMSGGGSDARKVRGQMVSKLMKEKGMTLGQASAHIKAHKLM